MDELEKGDNAIEAVQADMSQAEVAEAASKGKQLDAEAAQYVKDKARQLLLPDLLCFSRLCHLAWSCRALARM